MRKSPVSNPVQICGSFSISVFSFLQHKIILLLHLVHRKLIPIIYRSLFNTCHSFIIKAIPLVHFAPVKTRSRNPLPYVLREGKSCTCSIETAPMGECNYWTPKSWPLVILSKRDFLLAHSYSSLHLSVIKVLTIKVFVSHTSPVLVSFFPHVGESSFYCQS